MLLAVFATAVGVRAAAHFESAIARPLRLEALRHQNSGAAHCRQGPVHVVAAALSAR